MTTTDTVVSTDLIISTVTVTRDSTASLAPTTLPSGATSRLPSTTILPDADLGGVGSISSSSSNATLTTTTADSTITTAALQAREADHGPKTSLACLQHLKPSLSDITSACSCFSASYSMAPVTSTITAFPGPTCPGRQPTFPNCFNDFHPYNCGTDRRGLVACSCVLTTEGTAQCTLGDYERDNACLTSDDCADGWFCTNIDCFGDDVPFVCTRSCPSLFNVTEVAINQFQVESHGTTNLSVVVKGKKVV